MRLIDGDALIEQLMKEPKVGRLSFEAVLNVVKNMEPIEERKIGKWIEVDDAYNRIRGRCSLCGWEAHMYEDDVVGMDYCPNCGADMRGRQNG